MKLMVIPQYDRPDKGDGGIRRVVEAQFKYLPAYGFEMVDKIAGADIVATHAAEVPDIPVGMPWVVHNHGLYWAEYDWPGWGARVNAQVAEAMKRCDHVTAPSEWVAYAIKRGTWITPTVLHHGIDPGIWEPGDNEGYVLWNKARTDPISDPAPVNKLATMSPDVSFISTFGQPAKNVQVIGKKVFQEAMDDIRHAGVYLATTRETFGIGTLEAMACGVPILGWKWGGQAEIIEHGKTGWLSPPGDYNHLREGLSWCIEHRKQIGEAGRELVLERFTWDKVMSSYAQLYQDVYERQNNLNNQPKVSIITPCYNLGYLLSDMIKSVQDQTMRNWEIVIVDDHSDDDSLKTAKDLARTDKRIRVVSTGENLKLPGALNYGFNHALGRYVMNLDPDNMIPPNTLKILTDALDNDRSIHMAYGRIKFVLEDGVTPDPVTGTDDGISRWPPEFNCLAQFQHRNQIPSTCLCRREVYERTGGYRDRATVAEDAEFWTRAVSYGFQPRKVTQSVTYIYRYRPDSKSRGETEPDWTSWIPWSKDARLVPWGVAAKPPPEIGKAWPVPSCEPALVTVVIPVGPGHEKLVIDALDSVEAQTFRSWHCIVVNDTGKELKVPHPWVRIINTDGEQGPAVARNLGISASVTKAFVCLDADDILEPTCLKDMWAVWNEVKGVVYSQWWDEKNDGHTKIWDPPEWQPELLVSRGCIHASCAMYAKDAWEQVGGYDVNMESWEDWDFQIAYAMKGVCAVKIAKPLFTYRKTTGMRRETDMANKEKSKVAMRAKWPDIFDNGADGKEVLTMACGGCGKRRVQPPPPPQVMSMTPQSGMTLVEYLGGGGKSQWVGKVTGTKYLFGNTQNHKRKFVYNADLDGFLSMSKHFVITSAIPLDDESRPVLEAVMGR